MKKGLILAASLILLPVIAGAGCSRATGFDRELEGIAAPYEFSIVDWEIGTIPHEIRQAAPRLPESPESEARSVIEYFDNGQRIRALEREIQAASRNDPQADLTALQDELNALSERNRSLEAKVERVLEKQIRDTLAAQGIFNPTDRYPSPKITIPPLNFKLERPPHLLVVSPRDNIQSLREIILKQDMTTAEMIAVEAEADQLGVSSLVVELGGLGAVYPSFVSNKGSLRFTLNAATEEWLHQYLLFRPLGFLYVLDITGVSPDYEIATINETVVGIVSKEIGGFVYEQYYAPYETSPTTQTSPEETDSGFDFNREMRETRRQVDAYLAAGEIETAEAFMEQKRQYLAENGYYIRKLNQAYFAFHGTYGDSPTSISPIGDELDSLREQSQSLKDFLDKASALTSRDDIRKLLE